MARSTTLRCLYFSASKRGGRPPLLPRRDRLALRSPGSGIVAVIRRSRRWSGSPGWSRPCPRARARAGARPPATADPDTGHHRVEGQRVVPMPAGGDPRDRPGSGIRGQMNLAGQPAPGPTQRLPAGRSVLLLVIRWCPPWPPRYRPAPLGLHRPAAHVEPRHADGLAPLRRRSRPSTAGPLRSRHPGAAHPGIRAQLRSADQRRCRL